MRISEDKTPEPSVELESRTQTSVTYARRNDKQCSTYFRYARKQKMPDNRSFFMGDAGRSIKQWLLLKDILVDPQIARQAATFVLCINLVKQSRSVLEAV